MKMNITNKDFSAPKQAETETTQELEKIRKRAENVIKKHRENPTGDLEHFVRQCESSQRLEKGGLDTMNTNETSRRIWMQRITHERDVKQLLLDNGLLVTGWGWLSDDKFLDNVAGKNRAEFDALYQKQTPGGNKHHSRFCLYKFLCEFKKGDWVVVPGGGDFSIYEITGDRPQAKVYIAHHLTKGNLSKSIRYKNGQFLNSKDASLELGAFWEVKPVELGISRQKYADNPLLKRLKFMMTSIEMTDLEKSIEDAIDRSRNKNTISVYTEIVNATDNIILKKLQNTKGDRKLEEIVKSYLDGIGASSTRIPAKNSLSTVQGDVDVEAYFDDLQVRVLVQVKQHLNATDTKAVDQIINASANLQDETYTTLLWVVTTAEFTDDAKEKAQDKGVRLINGTEFARMLLDQGFKSMSL